MHVWLSRRARLILINTGLILSMFFTASLVRRQSLLLPETAAAARSTPQPNEQMAPLTPTPVTPADGTAIAAPSLPRAAVIDDQRFFYAENFNAAEIQHFLDGQPGPLKDFHAPIGSRVHSFAEILASRATLDCINPQVVLALIEQQSGLITQPDASPERMEWALNYHGEDERYRGFLTQVRWAIRELRAAQWDYPAAPEITYADNSHSPMPPGLNLGGYAITRVLAATTGPSDLLGKLTNGPQSFVATFTRLFGDPRAPSLDDHHPAAPFLYSPTDQPYAISSFFDHESPFLRENGSLVTYWGQRGTTISYDGHTGWDYAARPPAPVLAAADGTVVFAGNADDNCATQAVIIDHGNGYRTLYWHLSEILAEPGPVHRGDRIGIVGESGCATGPHLHLQVQFLGHDVDPYGWCGPAGQDPWAQHPAGQVSVWLWAYMPSPCALPSQAIVVEPGDIGWRKQGADWEEVAGGVGGSALRAPSVSGAVTGMPIGVWLPSFKTAGRYRILAWIPYISNGIEDAKSVRYLIRHADGESAVVIDQSVTANSWVDLGTFRFGPGLPAFVGAAAVDSTPGDNVWYDAIMWVPTQ